MITNTQYLWSTASRGFFGEDMGEKETKARKRTPSQIKINRKLPPPPKKNTLQKQIFTVHNHITFTVYSQTTLGFQIVTWIC